MDWISIEDELPRKNQKVIIWLKHPNPRTWPVVCAVFRKGKVVDETKKNWTACFPDQWGNNTVPYRWEGIGPMDWFGQEASHWMPQPEKP